jgi:type II secretory pathway component HofQ
VRRSARLLGPAHACALALLAAGAATAGDPVPPRQVEIEARFVEVRRADVGSLGFDWSGPAAQPLDPAKIPVLGRLLGDPLATRQATARIGSPAEIEVGDPKQVAVQLLVVPGLTKEGQVALRLEVQVAQPGLSQLLDRTLPVPGGQGVAVGGLFTEETRQAARGTPGLADVPVLGKLFTDPGFGSGRSDLLIFITPRVLDEEGPRHGRPAPQVLHQPRPDPGLEAPKVPQAPHQPKPGYGTP